MSAVPAERDAGDARVLRADELDAAAAVCALDPVASVLAASRIAVARAHGLTRAAGQVWGYPFEGPLRAVCWSGANLVPVLPAGDLQAARAFAHLAASRPRRASSIVGDRGAVMAMWSLLRERWSVPRDVRDDQPSLAIRTAPAVAPDPSVLVSRPQDFGLLLPACVRMFTEEVGYSPVGPGSTGYEDRVRSLIAERRSFRRLEGREVAFKAEIGAAAGSVAQIQGVWVPPHLRGRGLAAPGVAAVVAAVRSPTVPVVSLYVNRFNARALATYRRVGFDQVGVYATVLF